MRRLLALLICSLPAWSQTPPQQQAREIFKQLIEINTTDSVGDNTKAAEAMAVRFRAAGFPGSDVQVLTPAPRKGNLVVRYRAKTAGTRPILFMGHLDVVEAKATDWSFDPFTFREQDGYFFGRGTQDMKGDVALLVATFIRLKQEGYQPARDLVLALTADEENGPTNGMDWLAQNHRDLIDAEFAVNLDGGGGDLKSGKQLYVSLQAAEKVFLSFKLETTNAGGHSSRPSKDNAIYHLADGLSKLAKFDFPVRLFDVTRANLESIARFYPGQLGQDLKAVVGNPNDAAVVGRLSAMPQFNAQLRTTCVATMLSGGHAENALPQTASATVNCRLLPVDTPENVERTLNQVVADPQIKITQIKPAKPVNYKPIEPKVLSAVTGAVSKNWPGLTVIPKMSTGASDSIYVISQGIPAYGVSGMFVDEDDNRAHGRDERVLVKSFYDAVSYVYDLTRALGDTK